MGLLEVGDGVQDFALASAGRADEEQPDGIAVDQVRSDGAEDRVERASVGQVKPATKQLRLHLPVQGRARGRDGQGEADLP